MKRPLIWLAAVLVVALGSQPGPGRLESGMLPIAEVETNAPPLDSAARRPVVVALPLVPNRDIWHVLANAPAGGSGTAAAPFDKISFAIEVARPGDIILVHRGTYRERLTTKRDGRRDAPIRIVSGGAKLVGDGTGRAVQILHDYITLERFDITGSDILVWVQGSVGSQILNNTLSKAQGECIRIKYRSRDVEVAGNVITDCGEEGFDLEAHHKNGEGVYIGTAPEQLDRNPTNEPDASNSNHVHDNLISTRAECVDIKEGASNNLVESNHCSNSQDPDGSGFDSRGRQNTFRNNISRDNAGAGIRLGGDAVDDGIDNVVVGNRLFNNKGYGVSVQRKPQAQICGNTVTGSGKGKTNGGADPEAPCAPRPER